MDTSLDLASSPLPPLAVDRSLVPMRKGELVTSGHLIDRSGDLIVAGIDRPILPATDITQISPRKMIYLSMDLYLSGVIGWEEHEMLSFQADLHPDFGKTIGALTGQPAKPDQPKDFLAEWESRLAFQRRHSPDRVGLIRRTEHIRNVLHQINAPTRLVV